MSEAVDNRPRSERPLHFAKRDGSEPSVPLSHLRAAERLKAERRGAYFHLAIDAASARCEGLDAVKLPLDLETAAASMQIEIDALNDAADMIRARIAVARSTAKSKAADAFIAELEAEA